MKLLRKIMVLILVFAMISALFAACGDTAENAGIDTARETEDIFAADDSGTSYSDAIAAIDYVGYEFHMATNGLSDEYFSALDFEEITGEGLNDAIYERNRRVEHKFNIKLSCINESAADKLKSSVVSGTNEVDFVYVLCEEVMPLIAGGYLLPITDLGSINMSNPYWDKGAQETLMIEGKMYHGYLDISFDHYESIAALFYSGALITDFSLEDPYELYRNKQWTMDKMLEMMRAVSADLNNDGKHTVKDDRLGFVGREFQYLPMLYSSDVSLVDLIKENGTYKFKFNLIDERLVTVGTKINEMLNDNTLSVLARDDATRIMFKEGRALFYSRLLGDFRNLRDKEDDYGIISYPPYDYTSDKQYVYVQNPFTVVVPVNTKDIDRTGTIIESLAADTYDNVLEVYFERTVIGKGARDQNSAAMLRDMKDRRVYDLSYCFGLTGSAVSAYNTALKSGTYASMADRTGKSFDKIAENNIKKVLEGFDY